MYGHNVMFLQNESKLGPFCMCHPSKYMVCFYLEGYNSANINAYVISSGS